MAGRDGENLRMVVLRKSRGQITETEYTLFMRTPEKFAERIAAELDEQLGQTLGNVIGLYIGQRDPELAFATGRNTVKLQPTERE